MDARTQVDPGRRRRRRDRRRDRAALRARRLRRLRHAAQRRQARAAASPQIRAEGGEAHGFASDARKEADVETLVAHIEREIAPIEVAVFNIGANVRFGIAETTERVYRKVWEMGALAGFLIGREAAKAMLPRGRGTILFTGATASVRGSAGFAAFAGAKHALRALAQSMARELGPQGIHVAHLVIDGAIDTQLHRRELSRALRAQGPGRHPQPRRDRRELLERCTASTRSAWTHELDLRPWMESW